MLNPHTAHVWAAYVRADWRPDGTVALEPVVISWLPETLKVRPLAIRPEPGSNLTLGETFAYMSGRWDRLVLWGPFEVDARRFQEAVDQKARLDADRSSIGR